MADFNLIALTGKAAKGATLRQRSSGISKAEFSLEVERPFTRASGEPVSDLFLVDVYGALAERCAHEVVEGSRLVVIGTLNKESYMTRHGRREHMTVIKAKYFQVLPQGVDAAEPPSSEEIRKDQWEPATINEYVNTVSRLLSTPMS